MDRILKGAKQKGEKLLASCLSPQQKMLALHTAIDSYSFPLACMTFSDVNRLDMVRTRVCKKIHRLPMCTPSAMIHQDQESAGLGLTSLAVAYAKTIGKYLTRERTGTSSTCTDYATGGNGGM